MELSKEMLVDIAINIINILVLFFVVRKLAYKPVKKFMDERTQRIMSQKNEAQALKAECEKKSAEYDELLLQSSKAKEDAISEGKKEAVKQSAEIVENAKARAQIIIEDAGKKADEAHKKMLENAKDEIISLSVDLSEKLLSREISDSDNKRIAEEFLKSFEGQGENRD